MASAQIRVRFPPSPTGFCHVGTARMALLNQLFARKNGGTIVFRSEDTDRERSTAEYEEDIKESLTWLGLEWDEFVRQSDRLDAHKAMIQKLIAEDKAYVSDEESKKDPSVRVQPVRLRNPGTSITFTDIVRGDITFDTTELGDFVIARAIDDPLYHLAVVVDDAEMQITHVIRGEEHISNTPRQILIQEALGYARPEYAHYPLFLGADKSKLSKRKGDVAVKDYRAAGFLPEALLNFIGTLGWTPPSGREVLSLHEMTQEFDLANLHKSGAVFDIEKLRWYNRQYLGEMSPEHFTLYALPRLKSAIAVRGLEWHEERAHKLLPVIRERISAADEIEEMAEAGEFDFAFTDPVPDPKKIPQKEGGQADALRHLTYISELWNSLNEESFVDPERLKESVWEYATTEGRGTVLWPLRFTLSGRDKSPDPFMIASILGKQVSLERITNAIKAIDTYYAI